MVQNRKIFDESMRIAANAVWEEKWGQAIEAYRYALTEFPNDANALTGLGEAYAGAGQLEDALESYRRASEFSPDDPVLWERIGETLEQLGQRAAAAEAFLSSADIYLKQQKAEHLALERWQDAVRAYPDNVQAHAALLQYYQRHSQVSETVEECLALARIYHDQGRDEYAIQVCQHALKLTPNNPQVLLLLDNLRHGERAAGEPDEFGEESGLLAGLESLDALDTEHLKAPPEAAVVVQRIGPVKSTCQKALSDLAESIFSDEEEEIAPATAQLSKMEIDALISRAIDFQTREKVDEAIDAYEKVIAVGAERPAVHFNLGVLYQEKLRFDEAINQLNRVVSHPDYGLGSRFALGECYRARGSVYEALEHFIEGLKSVDMSTVPRERASELARHYTHLTDTYIAEGEEKALSFINSLTAFLGEEDWEQAVRQARQRLDKLVREGAGLSLAEMLAVPGGGDILQSIAISQEYVEQGVFYSALEECYHALGQSSGYLPLHQQLAQIFLSMGRIDEAVLKFITIANTYQVRGDVGQATTMYEQALKLAPMDTGVRTTLIDLLVSHRDTDRALKHYLDLADSYYHLAQMDQAREVYQQALRFAQRSDPEHKWAVRILHRMADIDMQHVDWKNAFAIYERIRDLAPDNERARLMLMDLHYRFNRPRQAIGELDALLGIYRKSGKSQRIFDVLKEAVDQWPNSIPLRARLAQVYLNAGRVEEALEHLDKLGDLQLEAGQRKEARSTVRAIIALNPPNVAEYQQLLDHLGEASAG